MNETGLTEATGQEILKELQALNKFNADKKKSDDEKEVLKEQQEAEEKQANAEKEALEKQQEAEEKKANEEILLQQQEAEKAKQAEELEKENADKLALENFRKEVLQEISVLTENDETEVLNKLDTSLATISQSLEENQVNEDVGNYTDLLIIFFLLLLVPAYLVYRGLSKFFDGVVGV